MQTIISTFDSSETAQNAVEELIQQGFSRSSIHLQSSYGGNDASLGMNETTSDTTRETHAGFLERTGNFFRNLFRDDDSGDYASKYSEAIRRGSTVVAVDAADDMEVDKARNVLSQMNPIDIDQRAEEWKRAGWTGFDVNAEPYPNTTAATEKTAQASIGGIGAETDEVLPVIQEELVVGKRAIENGVVRVAKRITETPVSELVNLRQESATIERHPVDRPATEADLNNFQEGTLEVREMAEEAVVGKTARVVEEVVVGKEVSEHDEKISDTVRRTEVDVERVPGKRSTAGETDKAGNRPGARG